MAALAAEATDMRGRPRIQHLEFLPGLCLALLLTDPVGLGAQETLKVSTTRTVEEEFGERTTIAAHFAGRQFEFTQPYRWVARSDPATRKLILSPTDGLSSIVLTFKSDEAKTNAETAVPLNRSQPEAAAEDPLLAELMRQYPSAAVLEEYLCHTAKGPLRTLLFRFSNGPNVTHFGRFSRLAFPRGELHVVLHAAGTETERSSYNSLVNSLSWRQVAAETALEKP